MRREVNEDVFTQRVTRRGHEPDVRAARRREADKRAEP